MNNTGTYNFFILVKSTYNYLYFRQNGSIEKEQCYFLINLFYKSTTVPRRCYAIFCTLYVVPFFGALTKKTGVPLHHFDQLKWINNFANMDSSFYILLGQKSSMLSLYLLVYLFAEKYLQRFCICSIVTFF